MTDVEQFLASKKRYRCERLSADLTIEQCNENKSRVPHIGKGIYKITSCEDCAGLGKAVEMEERMEKCGCGARATVKGKCRSCYDKMKHKERQEKKLKAAAADTPEEAVVVPVEIESSVGAPVVDPFPVTPPAVDEIYACSACKAIGRRVINTPCPACGFDPQLSIIPTATQQKPIHALLKAPPLLSMTLDFSADPDIYRGLIEHNIDEDQVIGLLAMLLDRELAVVR